MILYLSITFNSLTLFLLTLLFALFSMLFDFIYFVVFIIFTAIELSFELQREVFDSVLMFQHLATFFLRLNLRVLLISFPPLSSTRLPPFDFIQQRSSFLLLLVISLEHFFLFFFLYWQVQPQI